MRPVVKSRKWWLVCLPLVLASCGCHSQGETADHEADDHESSASVTVRAVPARYDRSARIAEGLGRCEALPDHIAPLTPAVEGHVEALLVEQGSPVKKDQPIVELARAVAQADLAEKTATRDGLIASLALLKSIPRPEERRASELAVEQAKIAVEQAKVAVDRLRPLVSRREVPESQLEDAERASRLAQIQLQTAEATLHVMLIGPRREAVAEAEGKIKTADALVAFSRAHLEFHTIRSPIDGVLDSLTCRPGQTIAIASPIGEIVDTRQVFASIWLAPRAAASVRVGQLARVRPADAFASPRDSAAAGNEELAGKVAFVGRVADPQTGNLPIRVLVDNPRGLLTIGQSLRLSIVVEELKAALQVPTAAVLDLGEGPTVSVVRDGKAVVLHLELGAAQGGWTEVAGTDLKPGEPVIVEGGYNLPENTAVTLAGAEDGAKEPDQGGANEQNDAGSKEHAEASAKEGAKS